MDTDKQVIHIPAVHQDFIISRKEKVHEWLANHRRGAQMRFGAWRGPFVANIMNNDPLTERVLGCAYTVSNTLGCGFLEKVYENALAHEMRKQGRAVEQQKAITVLYDGTSVGDYFADLCVDGAVIVELKAAQELTDAHMAQCINYLKATGMKRALLLNFGRSRIQIKRVSL